MPLVHAVEWIDLKAIQGFYEVDARLPELGQRRIGDVQADFTDRAPPEPQRYLGAVVGSFDHVHHLESNVGVNACLVDVEIRSQAGNFAFKNKHATAVDSCSTLTAKTLETAETAEQIQSVIAITTTTMKQVLLTGWIPFSLPGPGSRPSPSRVLDCCVHLCTSTRRASMKGKDKADGAIGRAGRLRSEV